MRIGWRRGTRAFVVGITVLTIVIAILAGRSSSSTHAPTATPRATASSTLPANCHTATLAGSRYTVCEETTPVPK
jgi:hypothetical protein